MTGREKLAQALAHQLGPIPVDCGSTAITGIHVSVVEKLREYYGLKKAGSYCRPISDAGRCGR